MNLFTSHLLDLLEAYGPWLLFVLTLLETSFLWGLMVPAGVAISVATVLALAGTLEPGHVVLAALAGGGLGDSVGYWIGRAAGQRFLVGEGRWARLARRRRSVVGHFLEGRPAYSVSAARLVSFVRTLMPMVAGMTGIPYARFLAYELTGLAGYVALYVSIGVVAEESWQVATELVGLGGATVFAVAGVLLWVAFWRHHRHRHVHPPGGAP